MPRFFNSKPRKAFRKASRRTKTILEIDDADFRFESPNSEDNVLHASSTKKKSSIISTAILERAH